jgi:hypothetical protein
MPPALAGMTAIGQEICISIIYNDNRTLIIEIGDGN